MVLFNERYFADMRVSLHVAVQMSSSGSGEPEPTLEDSTLIVLDASAALGYLLKEPGSHVLDERHYCSYIFVV